MRKLLFACGVCLCASAASAATTLVTSLSVQDEGAGVCRVIIKSNEPLPRHKEILFDSPPKMVIDVTGAVNRLKRQIKVKNDIVKRVRTSQFSMQPEKVRIVLDLNEKVTYTVEDGKTLTFVLKGAAAAAAAREDSLRTAALAVAAAESVRTADSLHAAAVAESLAAARGGIGAVLEPLLAGGIAVPAAAGGGLLLIVIIIMLVRSARKRKKAEAEFEDLLSKEAAESAPAGKPNNWFSEDAEGDAAEEGEKTEEDAKLDMLENELARVKEQADKLTEIGGFEVSVVDNEPEETAAAEPPAADSGPDASPPAEPAAPAGNDFNIDEFQKAFSGAGDHAPAAGSAADAPAADDDFDLDATIAQLKEKMTAPPPKPAPAPGPAEADDDLPRSLDDILDTSDFGPETAPAAPAAETPEPSFSEPALDDFLESENGPDEKAAAPEPGPATAPEPAEDTAFAAPEPAPPAVPDMPDVPAADPAELQRMQETMARYGEQEDRIVAQLDSFHARMEGYKKLLAQREARLAKMVELNEKISRDMDDVQAKLDASLKKLEDLQNAAPAAAAGPVSAPPAPDEPADTGVPSGPAPFIDVVVDDTPVDFTVETVETDASPGTPAGAEGGMDIDDVFGNVYTGASAGTESAPAGDDGTLPDFGAFEDEPAPVPAPAPAPEPAAEPAEDEPKFKKVFRLADAGNDVLTIAQQLGIGRGQVELFLKLREKGKMS